MLKNALLKKGGNMTREMSITRASGDQSGMPGQNPSKDVAGQTPKQVGL